VANAVLAAQLLLLVVTQSTHSQLLRHSRLKEIDMGHYAKVLNGKVTNVIVAEEDFFDSFVDSSPGDWIKTSYNTKGGVHCDPHTGEPSADQSKALRKNYAGIGFSYDKERDAFIPPKRFASWTLNEESCLWESPVPYPNDGNNYMWDEANQQWILIKQEQV
jgi:hypothetical protein